MSSASEPLSFTFQWDFAEHARFAGALNREYFSRGLWKLVRWGFIGIMTLLVVFGILAAIGGDPVPLIQLMPWLVLLTLWLLLLGRGTGSLAAWQTRRHDPNITSSFTHTLNDSGLQIRTRTADVALKWDGMHKVREWRDGFMFYYSARCAYQLPKRAIGDEAAVTQVREYIKAHLSPEVPLVRV